MQNIKLNLIPGAVMPVVNVSQYDKARQFSITVYEGASTYSLTGKDVQIRGTKPDGNGFAYDSTDGVVSVSGSTVTISTTQQMTAVGGQTMAELRITQSGVILGTLNFILMVEPSALSDDTPISDTDIPAIERDFEAALAEAEADALIAEGYAKGTQEGVPAQSGEPYYQDNAKYYKEQAEAAASGGGADALKAEGYAVGTQNGVPVTSGSPYYHNNAAYYEGEASTSATNAATSETNAGLSETAAGNSATNAAADALKSEGWAVGEQNGTPVTSGSPYYHNNAEYYKDQAAQYAAGGLIFKGSVAFASIPTTGMVNGDMYNITDDFTTDNRFIEGSGVSVKAGADIAWIDSVSKWDILALGGGSDDYSQLINKPQINSVELSGNKTAAALGLATDAAMTGASAGDAGAKGLVPAPAAGDQGKVLYGDGTWKTPSSASDMTGATASTPGTHGLVPAPAAGDNTKFLRGDGTWAEAGGGGGGFDYKDWLAAANIPSAGFADLAAVLADEETVWHLMSVHAAVDYLTGFGVGDTNIQAILNNDYAAKWINLRDYALDKLEYAFSALMASIDKYGYGEWAKLSESPETWGPKGCVPIMTSNTAPYGTASAYQVFDGNSATTASATDFSYQFTNPVCPKSFDCLNTGGQAITGGTMQGSNDGSTWETPQTGAYYLYLRVHFASSTTVATVQFYGRELKVSVPTMTSNTAPYGVASAYNEYGTSLAWKAFDGDTSSRWDMNTVSSPSAGIWIAYEFNEPIVVKAFSMVVQKGTYARAYAFKVQGYNNASNEWEDVTDEISASAGKDFSNELIDNANAYKKYRIYWTSACCTSGGQYWCSLAVLQFYGENYSEYDWDADHPRHTLYDHGLELSEFQLLTSANGWSNSSSTFTENSQKLPYALRVAGSASGKIDGFGTNSAVNASTYNLFRLVADPNGADSSNCIYYALSTAKSNFFGSASVADLAFYGKPDGYIDISSITQSIYLSTFSVNMATRKGDVYEMWLE